MFYNGYQCKKNKCTTTITEQILFYIKYSASNNRQYLMILTFIADSNIYMKVAATPISLEIFTIGVIIWIYQVIWRHPLWPRFCMFAFPNDYRCLSDTCRSVSKMEMKQEVLPVQILTWKLHGFVSLSVHIHAYWLRFVVILISFVKTAIGAITKTNKWNEKVKRFITVICFAKVTNICIFQILKCLRTRLLYVKISKGHTVIHNEEVPPTGNTI